jgi:hypothetical protein
VRSCRLSVPRSCGKAIASSQGLRVQFQSGQTTASFTVAISRDFFVEGNEVLNLDLTNPSGGAVLGGAKAPLIIVDDESNKVRSR